MISCDHYRVPEFDGGDIGDDEAMRRFSKKRNSSNSNHRTSIAVKSVPSDIVPNSPLSLASSSETTTSLSFADTTDAGGDLGLPKRIVTLNVVRPVPKRIAEQFYDDAYRARSTLHESNQAAVMAHDWHRKWTYQDEAYHTMPEEDFYRSYTTGIPESYCYNGFSNESHGVDDALVHAETDHQATNPLLLVLQREEGAKNPSLGSSQEGKRKRFSSQTAKVTTSRHHSATKHHQQHPHPSLQQSELQAFNKTNEESGYEGTMVVPSSQNTSYTEDDNHPEEVEHDQDNEHDDEIVNESYYNKQTSELQRPLPIRPMVVKPLAIRANRSEHIHPEPTYAARLSPFAQDSGNGAMGGGIPQDIFTSQRNEVGCVSPMSFSQLTGSSSISSSPGGEMMGMTVFKNDQEELHLVEDDDFYITTKEDQMSTVSSADKIEKERDDILRVLAINDGDAESDDFKAKIDPLEKFFFGKKIDTRTMPDHPHCDALASSVSPAPESINGTWLTLSKPNYFGKLGENDNGDPMYTLGRMSFDMFSPTNLVCSLQGNFNQVEIVNEDDRKAMLERVPKKLREEVENGKTILRTYHVITAFTIEPSSALYPNAPNKDVIRPIKGIMTTYGYSLPDPNTPNRHSIWFTGGRIEPNNDISDVVTWKNFFTLHPPKHTFGEKAKLLAVKLLMGATTPTEVDPEDGSMNYVFTRPLGGHGMAYIDVIYLDQSLRIVRGQRGTTFVFSRVPDG